MEFADASVLHVERPRACRVRRWSGSTPTSNPYHATIGLRIAPGPPGLRAARSSTEAPARDMPLYLFKSAEGFAAAIEKHVRRALEHGRYGWQVTDCVVTLTECGYSIGRRPAVQARTRLSTVVRLPEGHARRGARRRWRAAGTRGLRAGAAGAARGADRATPPPSSASSPGGVRSCSARPRWAT